MLIPVVLNEQLDFKMVACKSMAASIFNPAPTATVAWLATFPGNGYTGWPQTCLSY